ncbi:helix-turn-helix domain-containing protein [Enterobacteriaceae bacterium RIT711]|nr:helix-turn-helix domain-containing protein [Enterobacteriaceae bacterium RIT711]
MQLKKYLNQERGRAKDLAGRMNISKSYLSQMATGRSPISPTRCIEIERETAGAVSRTEMRPDDWHSIWPDHVPNNLQQSLAGN